MANRADATSQPRPEPPPVRPPTLPPNFPDIPQNPSSELRPQPGPLARADKVAGTPPSPVSRRSDSGRMSFNIEIMLLEFSVVVAPYPCIRDARRVRSAPGAGFH
jgi:hypothetical protein